MRLIAVTICSCFLLFACSSYNVGKSLSGGQLVYVDQNVKNKIYQIEYKKALEEEALDHNKIKELTQMLMDRSDVYCYYFLTGASFQNNFAASYYDIAAATLSAAVPVTLPVRNKNILSAVSGVSTTTKNILSNDILGGKDYGLIYDAVLAGRFAARKQIQADVDGGKLDGQTKAVLLSHILPYHNECGINFGLKYLRETLSDKAKTADTSSLGLAAADAAARAKAAASLEDSKNKDTAIKKLASDNAQAIVTTAQAAAQAAVLAKAGDAQAKAATAQTAQADALKAANDYNSALQQSTAAHNASVSWAEASAKAEDASKTYAAALALSQLVQDSSPAPAQTPKAAPAK